MAVRQIELFRRRLAARHVEFEAARPEGVVFGADPATEGSRSVSDRFAIWVVMSPSTFGSAVYSELGPTVASSLFHAYPEPAKRII